MRKETKNILINSFSENDKEQFKQFASIIENNREDISMHEIIWKYDQKLGGYGGYAAPLSPVINPFNHFGDYRNVYRSLQYGRSNMFIKTRPRHIIVDTAVHIETLVKLILSGGKRINFWYSRRELGKNIEDLKKKNIINNKLYERLIRLKRILNLAKHDTDPNNNITFDYEDAIVFYFETRKIGKKLMDILYKDKNVIDYDINYQV